MKKLGAATSAKRRLATNEVFVEIGSRISRLRKAVHLTQSYVAKKAGIDVSFYGQIERGANTPSIVTLLSIAAALRTDPGALIRQPAASKKDRSMYLAVAGLLADLKPRERYFVLGVLRDIINRMKQFP